MFGLCSPEPPRAGSSESAKPRECFLWFEKADAFLGSRAAFDSDNYC
jgi:hypothetical protein